MLKSVLARVSFINLKFFFLKDPTDVMDEDIAKKLSTLSPLITQMDHYCVVKKSILKTKCTRNIIMDNGIIAHDFKK
jgi:hypothetical protein